MALDSIHTQTQKHTETKQKAPIHISYNQM